MNDSPLYVDWILVDDYIMRRVVRSYSFRLRGEKATAPSLCLMRVEAHRIVGGETIRYEVEQWQFEVWNTKRGVATRLAGVVLEESLLILDKRELTSADIDYMESVARIAWTLRAVLPRWEVGKPLDPAFAPLIKPYENARERQQTPPKAAPKTPPKSTGTTGRPGTTWDDVEWSAEWFASGDAARGPWADIAEKFRTGQVHVPPPAPFHPIGGGGSAKAPPPPTAPPLPAAVRVALRALGLPENELPTRAAFKAAWSALARKSHPDTGGSSAAFVAAKAHRDKVDAELRHLGQ